MGDLSWGSVRQHGGHVASRMAWLASAVVSIMLFAIFWLDAMPSLGWSIGGRLFLPETYVAIVMLAYFGVEVVDAITLREEEWTLRRFLSLGSTALPIGVCILALLAARFDNSLKGESLVMTIVVFLMDIVFLHWILPNVRAPRP